ncbi:protocadherin gamma-B7-like [Homalodisca vitripennis]|uniref:protocadherin gamma-B7-like n=1 Tax=Homalodisca vitripennis TaxID=197043 RepID=UPI001EE9FAB9|nr:protocadherin gamma-B7-like [Homalodisca vitripennis]
MHMNDNDRAPHSPVELNELGIKAMRTIQGMNVCGYNERGLCGRAPHSPVELNKTTSLVTVTGHIKTLAVLDAETKAHYWLTVYAQDHGVAPLSSRLEVFISVTNINDNTPLSEEPVYYPHVPENSPANTPVLQITATRPHLQDHWFYLTARCSFTLVVV